MKGMALQWPCSEQWWNRRSELWCRPTRGKLWWLEELGCAMATDNLVPSSVLGIHHLGLAVRDLKRGDCGLLRGHDIERA